MTDIGPGSRARHCVPRVLHIAYDAVSPRNGWTRAPALGRNSRTRCMVVVGVIRNLFSYPDPVNENAARLVAAGVVALAVGYLITESRVVLAILAFGFVARVLTGPTLSPLAQIVNRLLIPWFSIPPKPVPGPPKRFAQGIGATLAVAAVIARLGGFEPLVLILVTLIGAAAVLESVFAFCVGCRIFGGLMAVGLVPRSVCEACNDLRFSERDHFQHTDASID